MKDFSIVFMNSMQSDIWRGGEKWMVNAASALSSNGHKVTCIGRTNAVWLEKAAKRGLKTIQLPIHSDFDPFIIWRLYRFFKKEKTQIICCNFEKDVRLGGIAAKIAGVPLIFVRKGLSLIYEKLRYKLSYLYIVDKIISPAYFIKDNFKKFAWIKQDNIHVIHNGVEIPDLSRFTKGKLRVEAGINDGSPVIMGAGSLHPQKGFQFLIESVKLIHDKGCNVHLVIAGGGDQQTFREIADSFGISPYVHFLGHRDDVRELMYGADIFVLSSVDEGLPNAVLEAMSTGTPVIAASAGGTSEIINDGVNGFIVPVKQSSQITEKAMFLLNDDQLRKSIGEAGLANVKQNFSMEAMNSAINKLFTDCLNEKLIISPK